MNKESFNNNQLYAYVLLKLNEMKRAFKKGDHVKWNSEAGMVSGKIIKIHIADFDYKGYQHHAGKEDPQYEIKVIQPTT